MRAGGIIGLKNLGEGKNTHYVLDGVVPRPICAFRGQASQSDGE